LIEQLPATALREWLADHARAMPLILDVREAWETAICKLAQAQLLPMQEIPSRWNELPRDRAIVVLCHHGMRSLQVATYLQDKGLDRLYNLSGGIAAWAAQIDPAMARY
jgi:rhodanese-related sulfurtransferase